MSRTVANIISHLFHPLLLPVYSAFIIFNLPTYISYSISQQLKQIIYIVLFITTFVMPVLFTMFLVQKKIVSSLELEKKEERKLPFIATAIFYLIAFYLIRLLPVPGFLSLSLLGATLVIIAGFLISLKWKISIHAMGIGGLLGLIWGLSEILYVQIKILFILLIILSGIIGTARLVRGTHTQLQIYCGLITGFTIELIVMNCYQA